MQINKLGNVELTLPIVRITVKLFSLKSYVFYSYRVADIYIDTPKGLAKISISFHSARGSLEQALLENAELIDYAMKSFLRKLNSGIYDDK